MGGVAAAGAAAAAARAGAGWMRCWMIRCSSRRSRRISTRYQSGRLLTADRGYGLARVERDLQELGVRTVAIP